MGELEGSGRGEKRADGLQKGVQEGQRGCQVEKESRKGRGRLKPAILILTSKIQNRQCLFLCLNSLSQPDLSNTPESYLLHTVQ